MVSQDLQFICCSKGSTPTNQGQITAQDRQGRIPMLYTLKIIRLVHCVLWLSGTASVPRVLCSLTVQELYIFRSGTVVLAY